MPPVPERENIKLSIIIPCFNETSSVEKMHRAVNDFQKRWNGEFEVVVVDDGSTDDTGRVIRQHPFFRKLEEEQKFLFIQLEQNRGKGAALKHGIQAASGTHLLTLDADMSTYPSEIMNWDGEEGFTFRNEAIAIGSRTHKKSQITEKKYRKIIGIVFNFFVRKLTGLKVYDTQCGFKLYPSKIGKQLFSDLKIEGWAHDVEILVKAKQANIKILQMPVQWNIQNNSKIRILRDSVKMFFQLIYIIVNFRIKNS